MHRPAPYRSSRWRTWRFCSKWLRSGKYRNGLPAAVSSIVDLERLRWVWLTHDDADHTGSIQRIMELAPNAKVVIHGFSALRMGTWWPVPMERVHAKTGQNIVNDLKNLGAVPELKKLVGASEPPTPLTMGQ